MAFLCVFGTGCSSIQQKAKQIATDWKADGREYGEETTYSTEDTVQTAFFKVKVNSVTTQDEIQGENDEYVTDRKSTRLNSSHTDRSLIPSSA